MNFYQRFLGDYMRDTMHLSVQEHGAYSLLLDTYYATERPLPSDYASLFRICRAMNKSEQESVRRVADQFFPMNADGLRHNRRADLEIASAQPKIKAAKENGSKGGRPRNPKETEVEPNSNPPVTQDKPTGLSETNPTETQVKPNGKAHQNQNHILNQSPEPPPDFDAASASPGSECFRRYSCAYRLRYGTDPVRNVKINSLFKQLVDRLGVHESAEVSEFYIHHNNGLYVKSGHAVNLLIRDAEKICMEWRTGKRITETSARQADRKDSNLSIARQLLAEEGVKNV